MKQPLRVLQLEDEPLDTEVAEQLLREEGMDAEIDRSEPSQGSRFWVELRRPENVLEAESVL